MSKSEASLYSFFSPPDMVMIGSPVAGSGRTWSEMKHANFLIDETSQYSFLFPKLTSVKNRVH
jgi:hypothetical protein